MRYSLDGTREITLADLEAPVAEGQHISASGTLTDANTLAVETALVRSPWEAWYMYAVSLLGRVWVLGRAVAHWRPDRDRFAVVPGAKVTAMADVFTHVLAGYILGMLLAFRYEWIRAPQVTLVMLGALSPDFVKIAILVPAVTVESVFGMPFSWLPLHTLGGNLVVIAITALLVTPEYRKQAFLLLALGAASHHALDLLLLNTSRYAYAVLWPLTEYHPPAGMLYRSSDRWPLVVAGALAVVLWQASERTDLWER